MRCSVASRVLAGLAFGIAAYAFGDLDGSYVLPLDHEAIEYSSKPVTDRAAALAAQLQGGTADFKFDSRHGYLEALLKALSVPVSSQVLVFSKTSFQAPRITPQTPRALYFSDDTFVGWVPDGDVMEIASVDPQQGVVFYTMDQQPGAKPKIERRDECLQCHASGGTLGVPGLMVRSLYVEPSGQPVYSAGGFITDHRSPFSERWGGWYVTGTHGSQRHMGNVFTRDAEHPESLDRGHGANVTDLTSRIDTGTYLAPSSDIVALMVLGHQTRMTNLITRVGWEARMALTDQRAFNLALKEPEDEVSDSVRRRINGAAEELVQYMLFSDEAQLNAPVQGTSSFAREFEQRGPRDHASRSLRQLDLTRRMFRYPCSFLIYSPAFDSLPQMVRERVYRRLWEVLSGADQTPVFARLTAADRKNVYDILLDTKPDLPAYWRAAR